MARYYMYLLMFACSCVASMVIVQQIRGPGNLVGGNWSSLLEKFLDRGELLNTLKSLPTTNGNTQPGSTAVAGSGSMPIVVAGRQLELKTNQVVRLQTEVETIVGRVLAWDDLQLVLLSDRGALRYVPWTSQTEFHEVEGTLQPLSSAPLQTELQKEFGPEFSVRASAQFVVVQPKNCQRDWARSMQQFYGKIQTYCAARQIPMKHPQFPLVAIVLPSRQAMVDYAAKQQDRIGSNFLAYYSLSSNRVLMYDSSRKDPSSQGALELATVFHEAFHQVAFNTGLHKRTAAPPLWISEGMAAVFETPGMADHRRSRSVSDRVHPDHLRLFLEYADRPDFSRTLAQLVERDKLFQTDATQAYAVSWAMAFYWMEHAPHAFADYLKTCNQRAAFVEADPQRRQREFQTLSKSTMDEFATRLKNYFERL